MASAVANNIGPSTVQLNGKAKVYAAKEKEAKHALQKEKIQHDKDLQVSLHRMNLLIILALFRVKLTPERRRKMRKTVRREKMKV